MKVRSLVPGIIVLGLVAAAVFFFKKSTSPVSVSAVQTEGRIRGSKDAAVTIVEYSDFQCPACQRASGLLKTLLEKYPKDVKIVFKHFPLSMHMWSALAHQASECALNQGKFWEFHDALYETQKEWSGPSHPSEKFFELAKKVGIDLDPFAACLSSPELDPDVQADRKKGEELSVNSTPTFFVNGERLVGPAELQIKGEALIRKTLGLPPLPEPEPAVPQAPNQVAVPQAPAAPVPAAVVPPVPVSSPDSSSVPAEAAAEMSAASQGTSSSSAAS